MGNTQAITRRFREQPHLLHFLSFSTMTATQAKSLCGRTATRYHLPAMWINQLDTGGIRCVSGRGIPLINEGYAFIGTLHLLRELTLQTRDGNSNVPFLASDVAERLS